MIHIDFICAMGLILPPRPSFTVATALPGATAVQKARRGMRNLRDGPPGR